MTDEAAWKCDSCHTNNYAGAAFCRLCQLAPGSATGVTEVVAHQQRSPETVAEPEFVPSKHGPEPRPTITLAPVPPKPTSPPRRTAPPTSRPAAARPALPRGTIKKLVKVVGAAFALLVLVATLPRLGELLPDLPSGSGTSTAEPSCPGEVARWLPGSGTGAVLIAQYDTGQHVVTICRDSGGEYHYDGQLKGKPVTPETHISLPASPAGTGFRAKNAGYLYEIDGMDLRLTKSGKPAKSWRLTRLGP